MKLVRVGGGLHSVGDSVAMLHIFYVSFRTYAEKMAFLVY